MRKMHSQSWFPSDVSDKGDVRSKSLKERWVESLGMVAKTVRGVSLGLGAEVLHEELLKCIIKSNLEQKILEHTQN